MRSQQAEPVGEVVLFGQDLKEVSWRNGRMPEAGTKLYAAPEPATYPEPLNDESYRILMTYGDEETKALYRAVSPADQNEREQDLLVKLDDAKRAAHFWKTQYQNLANASTSPATGEQS